MSPFLKRVGGVCLGIAIGAAIQADVHYTSLRCSPAEIHQALARNAAQRAVDRCYEADLPEEFDCESVYLPEYWDTLAFDTAVNSAEPLCSESYPGYIIMAISGLILFCIVRSRLRNGAIGEATGTETA